MDDGDSDGDTDMVDVTLLEIVAVTVPDTLALPDGLNVALRVAVDDAEPVFERLTLVDGLTLALVLGELLPLRDALAVTATDNSQQ